MSEKNKLTKHDMLYVRWRDSNTVSGWHKTADMLDIANDPDRLLCESIGFLVRATSETLTIAMSSDVDRTLGMNPLSIPREAVVLVRKLADAGGRRFPK